VPIFRWSGALWGFVEGDRLYDRYGRQAGWIEAVPGRSLEFRTVGQAKNIDLVPFYKLIDERYAVYWKVNRA